jgi:outer membrane protein assembly factor BamB
MQHTLTIPAFFALLATVSAADFSAECQQQWHQWRGPLANGTAPHGDPPVKWSETSHLQWKAPIPGEGSASPIVWRDQVFLVTAIRTDRAVDVLPKLAQEPPGGYKTERPKNFYRFEVLCLDRTTGKIRWQRTATESLPHEGRHRTNTYASASPTTDGQRLYVSFGSRGIYCYDLQGDLQWKRDLGQMITRMGWGEGASPTLHGNSLVVNWDQEGQSFLTVLDAKTGKPRWKVERDEATSWATPLVVERNGRAQLVVNATRRTISYDLESGKVLWQCGGQTTNVIPCPVQFDDLVIAMSGYQGNTAAAYAIPLSSSGDITDTNQIAWHYHSGTPYVPSPLLLGERLYFTKGNMAILTSLSAKTGKVLLEAERLPGLKNLYASPVGAQGRVYVASREGVTLVLKDQPKLEVLAENHLDEGFDASPAVVGRQLFLRGTEHLYCIAEE